MTEQQYTNRGFEITEIEVADYPGEQPRTLQVQESSLASERKVWLGQADGPGHGEPGRRFHLNEDEARQVRNALARFLGEEPSVQPPTREQIAGAAGALERLWNVTQAHVPAAPRDGAWEDYTLVAEALALFQQPTPSADEAQARIDQHMQQVAHRVMDVFENADEDDLAEDVQQQVYAAIGLLPAFGVAPTAEPVSVVEMAPGTTFRDDLGVVYLRLSPREDGFDFTDSRGYFWFAYQIDPSTIRDVTPPPATPEEGDRG
jgi:hypothetical protein